MAAVAREHIAAEGWLNVMVVESRAEDAQMAFTADAALFCAVHDILQSPDALRNVLGNLRPGAWVAAGGGKWAAPLMVAVNMQVRMLHAPYVRSFDGFDRPWNHLEQLIEGVHVDEVAFGGGYIATGRVPPRAPRLGRPGRPPARHHAGWSLRSGARERAAAAARRHRPARLEQRRDEQLRRVDAHAMIGPHLVDRGARDRPGQPELAARRHDAVPGGDDHRGRDIQLADPPVRVELADRLDGRDGGGQRGPAQLGAGPPGGRPGRQRGPAASSRAVRRSSAAAADSTAGRPPSSAARGRPASPPVTPGRCPPWSTAPGRTAARGAAWPAAGRPCRPWSNPRPQTCGCRAPRPARRHRRRSPRAGTASRPGTRRHGPAGRRRLPGNGGPAARRPSPSSARPSPPRRGSASGSRRGEGPGTPTPAWRHGRAAPPGGSAEPPPPQPPAAPLSRSCDAGRREPAIGARPTIYLNSRPAIYPNYEACGRVSSPAPPRPARPVPEGLAARAYRT